MSAIGQRERPAQNEVVRFSHEHLGYRYLGDWTDRDGNQCVEEDLLRVADHSGAMTTT